MVSISRKYLEQKELQGSSVKLNSAYARSESNGQC